MPAARACSASSAAWVPFPDPSIPSIATKAPGTRSRIRGRVRAVVTGGAGFIGSNLVDALVARGDEVVVVDDLSSGKRANVSSAAQLVEADIRSASLPDGDVVFHLAAQADVPTSVAKPDFDAEVNVVGTVRVLQAAGDTPVVFTSTGGAIYGECERPAREDDPRRPLSPYGIAKLAGEEYLAAWNRLHGTRHTALRFANVYGPRQEAGLEGGVVAIFLDAMAAGEETKIFGDGRQTRDFVHVDDVVRALLAAPGTGGVFNVGSGRRDLGARAARAVPRGRRRRRASRRMEAAREGDVQRSMLDVSRADRELGWRPEVALDEGLRRDLGLGPVAEIGKERAAAGRRKRPPWSTSPPPSSSALAHRDARRHRDRRARARPADRRRDRPARPADRPARARRRSAHGCGHAEAEARRPQGSRGARAEAAARRDQALARARRRCSC